MRKRRDPERLLSRVRLMATVPGLRSRFLDEQTHGIEQLAALLARRRGSRPDQLRLRVLALFDRAIDSLAEGISDVQSSVREGAERTKHRRSRR